MFRIKICGITNINDARAVAEAGADAVGLNFYPGSPRHIDLTRAEPIVGVLPETVTKVGLFVDAPAGEVCTTFDRLGLGMIQLHGDEPPEFLLRLGGRPVMRAFRLGAIGLGPVEEYLRVCRRRGCTPDAVLLDAYVPGTAGGTGTVADWAAARMYRADMGHPPLVLAGGLTAANVVEAIRAVGPVAVDTASGVESSPGRKDPAAVAAFVRAARAAFGL